MQHPFAGVIAPAQKPDSNQAVDPALPNTSRRGLFGLIAGALAAGTFGLLAASSTAEATTVFWGEEGARRQRRPTTLALGEEGGRPRTTMWGWEEGGHRHRRMKK